MNNRGKFSISIGLLLIVAALFLSAYNIYDDFRADRSAKQAVNYLEKMFDIKPLDDKKSSEEVPDYILNPDMDMPEKTINGNKYIGILKIKALDLNLPVISHWSYPRLKEAPCRYSGSAYKNNLVIAAHNYRAYFGDLKDLSEGDKVKFIDTDGNIFRYKVVLTETLQPTDIKEMTSGDWDLTLFTCTVGGTYRVAVRCDMIENK